MGPIQRVVRKRRGEKTSSGSQPGRRPERMASADRRSAFFLCSLVGNVVHSTVSAGWLKWIDADNSLDPIRDHPRFVTLIARGRARFEGGAV